MSKAIGIRMRAVLVAALCLAAALPALAQRPATLAILPFENNSVTDPQQYAPLSKGLSAMLITDLQNSGADLKIIEREKIKAVLQEIALGQTGAVDQATAIEAGRILGAQSIAFGSFMVLGEQVRIDVRIIMVETSETVMGDSVMGSRNDFIELERKLAMKIANSMQVAFRPEASAAAGASSDISAALYFSKGLDALDEGKTAEADRLFAKCIQLDPAYEAQVENVKGLK